MNPIVLVELPRSVLLWLDFACLAMFLISLARERDCPLPPVLDPTPPSESR